MGAALVGIMLCLCNTTGGNSQNEFICSWTGPGCSSFGVGALSENGPFHPRGGKLIGNKYSWNKAEDNLRFLHGWFDKFPEYKTRDLYLIGESYAGHYIPQWAKLIVKANIKEKIFNLKGIAKRTNLAHPSSKVWGWVARMGLRQMQRHRRRPISLLRFYWRTGAH